MKRCTIIIVLKARDRDLEIPHFLEVVQLFVAKVCKELKADDGDSKTVAKSKMPAKGSNTI